ncbi:MAG: hypothetical protein KAQ69_02315 [Spirochaetales bacterium]|nr:hypothetical protein [Spirochaetales bacterium]
MNYLLVISQVWIKHYFLIFIIYSFIGWVIESGYRSVLEKGRFVNSGFLYGPFIPIYGFSATTFLLIELLIGHLIFPLQILIFTIAATVIEYLTSFIFEKYFSMRLWDYSNYPLNINGRVCLLYCGFWGILSAIQIIYIQTFVDRLILILPLELQASLPLIFLVYVSFDVFYSTRLYLHFAGILSNIKGLSAVKISTEIRARLQNVHPLSEMKSFLRPLRVFPNLSEEFSESVIKFPGLFKIPYFKELGNTIHSKLDILNFDKNDVDKTEFKSICKEIIEHPEYQKLKKIKHHDKDIYSHNLKVAWISYLIAEKFQLHSKEMVRGALLHDFFLYNWREKGSKDEFLPHGFTHPFIAKKNAEKAFGRLTPIERDIIMKHMWPLTVIPPRYTESFLVSFIDKLVAGKEVANDILYRKKKSGIDE